MNQKKDVDLTLASRPVEIPRSIKLVTWVRAIRWFGWGFGETLLPIFIVTFSASLTEAGFVSSMCDIVFLLTLPLVSLLADSMPSRTLLAAGLIISCLVGVSFSMAAATKLLLFVLLARAINGISFCLDTVATDTYLRRTASRDRIASAFGYLGSVSNLVWLVAAMLGVVLVRFVSIGQLLFLIAPFSLLALVPLLGVQKDVPPLPRSPSIRAFLGSYARFRIKLAAMDRQLWQIAFFMFIFELASITALFFIPINAYRTGASLSAIAFLVVLSSMPSLVEFWLAKTFIAGSGKKRRRSLYVAMSLLPVLFAVIGAVETFSAQIVVALGIEVASVLGSLSLQSYATDVSRYEQFGQISGVLEGAITLGGFLAPITIGVLSDSIGFRDTYYVEAIACMVISTYLLRQSSRWLLITEDAQARMS